MGNQFIRRQVAVIAGAVIGTSIMTAYSWLMSTVKNNNFKEPVLLGQMAHRLTPWVKRKKSRWVGWGMHYLVGLLFAESYAPFFSDIPGKINLVKGLVFGGLSGIAAILIWKFSLDSHPLPPHVNFIHFAGQLFVAHLIFGFFAAAGFDICKSKNK